MGIADTLRSAGLWPEERSDPTISIDQWLDMFSYNGVGYPLGLNQTLGQKADEIGSDFSGMVQGAYRSNGVVFACMLARQMLFSEARFQFRQVKNGRPGDLFGTKELSVLEKPWPNGTTGSMLTRALQDVDLAGNAYMVRRRGSDRIVRARPDWITIVMRSNRPPDETLTDDLDAELVGYLFHPGGVRGTRDPIPLLPEEVAHFAPHPDPTARYRGESWLSPIIREIQADQAATTHKLKFFENGATPNLIVKTEIASPEAMEKWAGLLRAQERGRLQRLQEARPRPRHGRDGGRDRSAAARLQGDPGRRRGADLQRRPDPPDHRRRLRGPELRDVFQLRPGPPRLR
jgi:hypothetical protein